jgi:malonate-semialdehyde dehydrogenase (acetylating)/methylmalonate-semialdehyde dehydrogenase
VTLVNGGRTAVDTLLDHPDVRAISFVGSSAVAQYIYSRAAAAGKRVQCQGGAKNPVVVMPDADVDMTVKLTMDSAFGCAGQRCLAASVAVPVGEAHKTFTPRLLEAAAARKVGYGLDDGVEMGPVITAESRTRIEGLVQRGEATGGRVLVDGRRPQIQGYADGNFVRPTVVEFDNPGGELAQTEIFGPVLSLTHVNTLDDAIAAVNASSYGNMACIFTSSGAAARTFRYEGARRQHRRQHRRRRADGVLPLLRLEGQLLRRPARAGARRHRVLHGQESRGRTVAEGVVAAVLKKLVSW